MASVKLLGSSVAIQGSIKHVQIKFAVALTQQWKLYKTGLTGSGRGVDPSASWVAAYRLHSWFCTAVFIWISITVIKHHDQNLLVKERVYFSL